MVTSVASCATEFQLGGDNGNNGDSLTEAEVTDPEADETEGESTDEPVIDVPSTEEPTQDVATTENGATTEELTTDEFTTDEFTTDEHTTEELTTDEPADEPFVPTYDGIFQTGYARADITPSVPVGEFTRVGNNIYATCVAVYDGTKTLILVSIEVEALSEGYCDWIREEISALTRVSTKNIFISAVHNHSAPHFGSFADFAVGKIADAAKDAIRDLSDTSIFIGTGKTTGMAFVRRYVDSNGNYASVNITNADGAALDSTTTRCVSEADDTVQVIRFKREGKKDIIAANWQAHLAHAIDEAPGVISADMLHYMRNRVESRDDDALLVYFAGASANINLNAPNIEERRYRNYTQVANAFANVVLSVARDENLKQVNAGKIKIKSENYSAAHEKDSPEEIAAAMARLDADMVNPNGRSILKQKADSYLISRNYSSETRLRVSAIAFGDLAFITAPYEMFDNNGVQIKERSPFEMTFILTNSDGAYAYMPSYEACTIYGGYEAETTYFATGVAERLVNKYVTMLNRLK